MLTPENSEAILKRLDEELIKLGERRSLIACGGAALIAMNIIDRTTRDIDIIMPKLDPVLEKIAAGLAVEFGLSGEWLNNGPESLAKELSPGWEKRTKPLFVGTGLELRVLSREDLLASKVFAFCDREDDFQDVVRLQPTPTELNKIFDWVMKRDISVHWPKRVEDCFQRLRKALKYE